MYYTNGWELELLGDIARRGPDCKVVDKFGTTLQVKNGKVVAIPTPDRFPLEVQPVDKSVKTNLSLNGNTALVATSPLSTDVIKTPSPRGWECILC